MRCPFPQSPSLRLGTQGQQNPKLLTAQLKHPRAIILATAPQHVEDNHMWMLISNEPQAPTLPTTLNNPPLKKKVTKMLVEYLTY